MHKRSGPPMRDSSCGKQSTRRTKAEGLDIPVSVGGPEWQQMCTYMNISTMADPLTNCPGGYRVNIKEGESGSYMKH